jgi:phage terminase large subunit-like protein
VRAESEVRTARKRDNHLARTNRYIRDLAEGRIHVAEITRLAARRHLADLDRQDDPAFAYEFNEGEASKALRFCHLLPHVKGDLAGQDHEMHEWGCFFVASVFGWRVKGTGARRFREALAWVPRGNDKSTILSMASLYAAFGEGGQADVFSLATTKEQAGICWGDAASMLRARPAVKERLGIEIYKTALVQPGTNSSFRRLASKDTSLDGLNVSWATMDELHEVERPLYEVIKTALGKRANSILVSISTAGMDSASFGREMYRFCRQVLTGEVTGFAADLTFALIYECPEGADPYSEEAQRAANPMFGLSVRPEILRAAAEKAKRFATHRAAYLVKHLNIWVTAAIAYFDATRFAALADPSLKLEDFAGVPCFDGLDLAGTSAFTAKARVFVKELLHQDPELAANGETQRHYYIFPSYWLNKRAIDAAPTDAYASWVADGWVEIAGQEVTDFTPAKNEILADLSAFNVIEIPCDPHLITQLLTLVGDEAPGAPFTEYPQKTQFLSPAMKELNNAILEGRAHHNGNPVLLWNVGNVEAKEDANENVFPLKAGGKGSPNYIDGVSAILNAIGRALVVGSDAWSNVTEIAWV